MMADTWATIVAALIGASLGSLGPKIYETLSRHRAEKEQLRQEVVERYLFQLQAAVDDLWYRLDNLKTPNRDSQNDEYFKVSTLYALGRVLAYDRILHLEGIYPRLERLHAGKATELRKTLRHLDLKLNQHGFYRYDRLALAESVLERTKGYLGTGTYLEFKRLYMPEDSLEHASLQPAREYIARTTDEKDLSELQDSLGEIAQQVARITEFPSEIHTISTGQNEPAPWGSGATS
jgi:hypothetical protein